MSKKKSNTTDYFEAYTTGGHTKGKILGIDFTKNPEQRELIRLMNESYTNSPIICALGNAGTGKTFTALAAAIDLVRIQKKYSKIYYIREPLEVGKSLGFLPGDLNDKYGVYCDGLFDNLEHISKFSGINVNDLKMNITCVPPQFARGRSWEDALIIVDESQNLSLDTIQTLATRIGKYCKMVFLGSMNQIDIRGKGKDNNDFRTAIEIFENIDANIFSKVELIKSERSEYCEVIDRAFAEYKESHGNI